MTLTGPILFVKGYRYLRWLYFVWLALILFGRVYLGQHYLTDVIGGIVLSLVFGYALYRYRERINALCMRILSRLPLLSRLAQRLSA
jgi:membrane-associated phospholipid phosphatase